MGDIMVWKIRKEFGKMLSIIGSICSFKVCFKTYGWRCKQIYIWYHRDQNISGGILIGVKEIFNPPLISIAWRGTKPDIGRPCPRPSAPIIISHIRSKYIAALLCSLGLNPWSSFWSATIYLYGWPMVELFKLANLNDMRGRGYLLVHFNTNVQPNLGRIEFIDMKFKKPSTQVGTPNIVSFHCFTNR